MTISVRTAALLLLVCAAAASAQEDSRLILGFETDELRQKKGDAWCTLTEVDGGCDFAAHFEYGEQNSWAWRWRCRGGEVTEGRQALVCVFNRGRRQRSFQPTPFVERYYPVLRDRADASVLLSTFQFLHFAKGAPGDWSGYDRLWVDFRIDKPVTRVWLAVEDQTLEPWVLRTFDDVPAGEWVTLELDLGDASRLRGLDLAHVTNVYLLAAATELTTARVDNVRIVRADVRAKFRVLRDATPMKVPVPAFGEKPVVPPLAKDYTPDRSPVTLEPPRDIADGSLVPFGWIAAADSRFMLLGCMQGSGRWRQQAVVLQSGDGGRTWDTLARPGATNFDHGTARGSVLDARGDVAVVSSGPGCAGIGVPTPRQHFSKYTFTGTGYERRPWASVLDSDMRHCASAASVIRLDAGAHAGRLWATWGALDRMRRLVVHARYSDDDGVTWWHDGKGAMVPGSAESPLAINSYGYQQPRVTAFGDHAAVFWQDAKGLRWSRFNGRVWSPAEVIDAEATAKLAVSEGESFRVPGSVVTLGSDGVFLTAWGRAGVYHYNGKSWRRELPGADDAGVLTVSGGRVVCLVTAGSTEQPPPEKRIEITRKATVRCYRRRRDGTWTTPVDLSGGEVTLHEYRQMLAVLAPPASPSGFVPVAFSDGRKIRLVRVPVTDE